MEGKPHILVVDDDDRLRELLQRYLSQHEFAVTMAADAAQARRAMRGSAFDLMVLDIMMPGETGLSFATDLRRAGVPLPILMLTAMGEAHQRIEGLETGVDDYLAKPFEPRELVLRISNILRRSQERKSQRLHFGEFTFDTESATLNQGSATVYLTSSEANLLRALATHAGEAVPREELARLSALSGTPANERSIDVQINRLRKKIEPDPAKPIYIQTIRNAGYTLKAQEQ